MALKKKKGTGTAITKWDAKMAELAARATKVVKDVGAGGNVIGTAGGQLKYKGAVIPGNKLNCVVLAHVLCNTDYDGPFDSDNPSSPRCFAFGADKNEMTPHEDSAEKQSDACVGCPQNEWGSADVGKGKHCANKVRLGLISDGDLEEDIAAAEVAYIHIPVTSVTYWAGFVRQIADTLNRPPYGVICELSLIPSKNQFDMQFKPISEIEDGDIMGALIEKAERVEKDIEFPYVAIEKPAAPARRANKQRVVPPTRGAKPAAGKKSKFA